MIVKTLLLLGLPLLAPVTGTAQLPRGDALFQRLDRDRDGQLSQEEALGGVRQWFAQADSDRDGKVTAAEAAALAARWQRQGQGQTTNQGRGGTQPGIPEGVEVRRDLDYVGAGNRRQMLDLYLPRQAAADKLPLVVFIHGGAWRAGDKGAGTRWLAPLVAGGRFAGASIHYRLTDEAKWPAQIHDCKAAIRFLRGKAAEFGLDPAKIAVWGSSAGGHLVSMLGTSGGVPELEGDLGPFPRESSRVTCVVNFFGPQDFLTMVEQKSGIDRRGNQYPEALLVGGDVRELREQARQASPVTWISADDPPFLTAHGTQDPTVPFAQAEELDAALKKAGVASCLIPMQGAGHGFDNQELRKRIEQFLCRHLLDQAGEPSNEPIEVSPAAGKRTP